MQWKAYFTYRCKWNFSHISHIFLPSLHKIHYRHIHKTSLKDYHICESHHQESLTLPWSVIHILSILRMFTVWFGWNFVYETEYIATVCLWFSSKSAQAKPNFSYGHEWTKIYVCTMKLYEFWGHSEPWYGGIQVLSAIASYPRRMEISNHTTLWISYHLVQFVYCVTPSSLPLCLFLT